MKNVVAVLCIAALLAGAANAAIVSLNFENWGTIQKSADITAGVVNAGYWNDTWDGRWDKWIPYPDLTDSTGAATTMDAAWTADGEWGIRVWDATASGVDTAGTHNVQLMKGYIDSHAPVATTITLTEIPYALYDIYVYVISDGDNREGSVNVGSSTFYFRTDPSSVHFTEAGTADYVEFKKATATDAASAVYSNYAVFSGFTGSAQTISTLVSGGGGIAGIQIVEVPEPATMILLGLGGLLLRKKK